MRLCSVRHPCLTRRSPPPQPRGCPSRPLSARRAHRHRAGSSVHRALVLIVRCCALLLLLLLLFFIRLRSVSLPSSFRSNSRNVGSSCAVPTLPSCHHACPRSGCCLTLPTSFVLTLSGEQSLGFFSMFFFVHVIRVCCCVACAPVFVPS